MPDDLERYLENNHRSDNEVAYETFFYGQIVKKNLVQKARDFIINLL